MPTGYFVIRRTGIEAGDGTVQPTPEYISTADGITGATGLVRSVPADIPLDPTEYPDVWVGKVQGTTAALDRLSGQSGAVGVPAGDWAAYVQAGTDTALADAETSFTVSPEGE